MSFAGCRKQKITCAPIYVPAVARLDSVDSTPLYQPTDDMRSCQEENIAIESALNDKCVAVEELHEDEDGYDSNQIEVEACRGSLEVDPSLAVYSDCELDYSDCSSYCTNHDSLSSSINQYFEENGRRYHSYFGTDKYLMPTDEIEQERLNMHHEIMLALLEGKLHLAPIEDPERILDIGTGTGIWATDMADIYQDAEVVGIDISPIQPSWVPANCKFEVDDVELEWEYDDESFDFIHVRNLAQSITDWETVMGEIYRCVIPNGWVELAETGTQIFSEDNTLGEAFVKYHDCLNDAMMQIGRPPPTSELLQQRLEDAGFVDIKIFEFKQPWGPWPKDERMKVIGSMFLLNAKTGMEAYGLAPFTRVLGTMDPQAAQKLCEEGLAAAESPNHHMYSLFHVAYGRRPETDDIDDSDCSSDAEGEAEDLAILEQPIKMPGKVLLETEAPVNVNGTAIACA